MKYVCPLCKSPLTKEHYHRVLKIQEREEKLQKGELEKMRNEVASAKNAVVAAKKREREIRLKAKEGAAKARQQATLAERKRSERLFQGQSAKMKKLQDRIKMLESGTTPQVIGLADEGVLVERLKKEFPTDRIQHKGKGGDVLQFVVFSREDVGCIVYECKHTDHISGQHIAQTVLAKRTRGANFAILVTTGRRKGFSGLDQESGVFIVAPGGVLTLAHFCRDSLVSMAKQRLDAAAREAAAKRLMDYITSPTCKTPLEQAISQTERAGKKLMQEVQQHIRDWRERYDTYQTIHYDVAHIRTNIGRVLDGQEPMALAKPKLAPLALPLLGE
jgi:uncharacterized protein YbaR (Trm112 family)